MKTWRIILAGGLLIFPVALLASQAGTEQPHEKTAPVPPRRIWVGGKVMGAKLIHQVTPRYPQEAKKKGIKGKVRLKILVDRDGKVIETDVLSGDPLLAKAACKAVGQWRYKPTLLNGEPFQVMTEVDVNFIHPR